MKFNKQTFLLVGILLVGIIAYSFIPKFEREEFNTNIIEDISSGTITTTTIEENSQVANPETELKKEDEELFETSIYDSLLINNTTKRIEKIFTSYLVIGSDERSESSSASRGIVELSLIHISEPTRPY